MSFCLFDFFDYCFDEFYHLHFLKESSSADKEKRWSIEKEQQHKHQGNIQYSKMSAMFLDIGSFKENI